MKDVALRDQIMNNLAFEVEAVPQEDEQISSASNNSPINVKIRIRKKNRKQPLNRGVISIPIIGRQMYKNEKIRISNSDQTIMSFNVLMEREESVTRPLPKQKRIFQLFKRGGCLGIQNDEDQYEYSIDSTKNVNKNHKELEPIKIISSDTLETTNFTLTKNYSNLETTHENKQKHKDFLGKCKPGGCLDPPFGEEKYSYLPKLIDISVTKQNEIKKKYIECECDETFKNNTNLKSNKKDTMSNAALIKKKKSESLCATDISLKYMKDSNSIITFPSISASSEALSKRIHKRPKSYSSSKESESYNVPNQLLETYYISPKLKLTKKTSKSILDSDTGITDTVCALQNQEFLLNEATLETLNLNEVSDKLIDNIQPNPYINVNVPLEFNDPLKNNEEVITNFAISHARSEELRAESLILNSALSTAILKEQCNKMEIGLIACTEKKSVADINVISEIISSSLQTVRSSMKLIKLNEEQAQNLEIDKLEEEKADTITKDDKKLVDGTGTDKFDNETEPQLLHDYNNDERVVKSHDHLFHTERLNAKYSTTEDRLQRSEYSIKHVSHHTDNIDNIIATNADNAEQFIGTPQDYKSIINYSEKKDTASEIYLQESQLVTNVTSVTSKKSSTVTNYKQNIETIETSPQDLIFKHEELPSKDIIQEKKETLKTSEDNIQKKNTMEIINALPDDHMLNNYDSKITNMTDKFPSKEKDQAIVETLFKPVESYVIKNKNNIGTVFTTPQHPTVNSEGLNIINVSAELPSEDIGQVNIETVIKSVDSFITKNKNGVETVSAISQHLTANNKDSNVINVNAELLSNEINQVTIETVTKSVESFVTKNKNGIETLSSSPQYLIVESKDSNIINVDAELPPKEIDQVTLDIKTKSVESAMKNVKNIVESLIEKVPVKEMEATTKYIAKTEEILASTQGHLFGNKELKLKNVASKIHDSTKEHIIDVSNISMKSIVNITSDTDSNNKNYIKTMTVPQKDSSFKDEGDYFKITDEIEVNVRESNQPILTMSGTKNTDDIEIVKSLQDKESLKLRKMELVKHIDEDTRSDNKIVGREENIVEPYTKTNSVSLISTKDNKMEGNSNSILNWDFQYNNDQSKETKSEVQSFQTDRNNVVLIDVHEQQTLNNQESPVITTISNIEGENTLHNDINSVFSNIVDVGSSTTKQQEIKDPIKANNTIFKNNVFLKQEDEILSDKNMKTGKLTPSSSLSNSTYKIGIPTRTKLNLSNRRNRNSKGSFSNNIHYTTTIPSNNISANTKEERNLKHTPLKNYNGKEVINLNMAFQSFCTDKGESFINTLDSTSFNKAKRYLNDNVLQFKTILKPNEGEIKIPIDTHKYLVVHITTDQKSKDEQINKTLPNINMQLNSQYKLLSSKAADKENSFRSHHPATNDFQTVTSSIKDRATISESNLHQTLNKVYKDKLLPLHDVIKKLKDDIEQLSKQQALIKDKLYKTNVVQSKRIQMTGNKCDCIEMFARRL